MLVMDGSRVCVMHHFVITQLFVPHWHCSLCQCNIPDESVDDVQKDAFYGVSHDLYWSLTFLLCHFCPKIDEKICLLLVEWRVKTAATVGMDRNPLRTTLTTMGRVLTQGQTIRLAAILHTILHFQNVSNIFIHCVFNIQFLGLHEPKSRAKQMSKSTFVYVQMMDFLSWSTFTLFHEFVPM